MKLVIALAFVLSFVATAIWAEPASWNKEKVTPIAVELAAAIGDAQQALRKLNAPQPGPGRRAFHAARDDARSLRNSSRHLATTLEAGGGYDETLPTYRRIRMLRRDAAENLRSAGMIPDDVLAKIDECRDLLFQLSRYYEGD